MFLKNLQAIRKQVAIFFDAESDGCTLLTNLYDHLIYFCNIYVKIKWEL